MGCNMIIRHTAAQQRAMIQQQRSPYSPFRTLIVYLRRGFDSAPVLCDTWHSLATSRRKGSTVPRHTCQKYSAARRQQKNFGACEDTRRDLYTQTNTKSKPTTKTENIASQIGEPNNQTKLVKIPFRAIPPLTDLRPPRMLQSSPNLR